MLKITLHTLCLLLAFIANSFGLAQQTNGVTSMGWQRLETSLPANPVAIAASTDPQSPDFVAVASDANNTFYFYLLDHSNLQLGWQKKQPFLEADVTNLQYGLGHFVAMGTDRSSGKPVLAISGDNGRTWTQNLIFAGTGHYDNAAFSDQTGLMTGKDGAIAITTDGVKWAETTPPSGAARKVFYGNIAPSGAPIDNQFQLCLVLPTEQELSPSRLYGFLTFQTMPVLGSLISSDGKNWNYTIPYPIMKNQVLLYQNKTFLVNDRIMVGTAYSYHNSTDLKDPNIEGLLVNDPLLPLIDVFQFASYRQTWVAVGYNIKTGAPLSLVSNALFLNDNIVFYADFFQKAVRIVAANQCGFLAIADDGTSYYSTPTVPTKN